MQGDNPGASPHSLIRFQGWPKTIPGVQRGLLAGGTRGGGGGREHPSPPQSPPPWRRSRSELIGHQVLGSASLCCRRHGPATSCCPPARDAGAPRTPQGWHRDWDRRILWATPGMGGQAGRGVLLGPGRRPGPPDGHCELGRPCMAHRGAPRLDKVQGTQDRASPAPQGDLPCM